MARNWLVSLISSLAILTAVAATPVFALEVDSRDYNTQTTTGTKVTNTEVNTQPTDTQDPAAQYNYLAYVPWVMGWISHWWYIGLIFGFLLFIPWVVVGWEWWRGRWWVFAWPYPYWFWIPFIWFIPWLFFWWWGGWWFWWAWFWWLWPWGFWIGWWVVFLKHALMWVKSKR